MKNILLTTLLLLIAGVQTAMAQKLTIYMSDNQTFEYDISKVDSIAFSEAQPIQEEEIIVTVDANGNADGEHWFEKIDETNFYIDDIKYTAQSGDLYVSGYNRNYFKGTAKVISKLKYQGRTMNVVEISQRAFQSCGVLTSVIIGKGLTSIEREAFSYCRGLTSIAIPHSVTSIGNCAFDGCSSLTSIIIPEGVTSIGGSAFYECSSLTSVIIPESVTSIGSSAFYGCSSLTSINIPDSVTSIGGSAFRECSSLTSITIPNSVTSIDSGAFSGCSSLTSIQVEEGNTTYDSRNNCNAIIETTTNTLIAGCQNTVIPEGVTSIGYGAFVGCTSLASITIPSSVTSIDNWAFSSCSSLTDVYCYAENVPQTRTNAFEGSPIRFATLHVPIASLETYRTTSPWSRFNKIVAIDNTPSINFADADAKALCIANWDITGDGELSEAEAAMVTDLGIVFKGNKQIRLFDELQYFTGLVNIVEKTFYSCSGLTSITIPQNVTNIGNSAFAGCSNLTTVNILDFVAWCSIFFGNATSQPLYNAHHLYLNGQKITDLVIPESIININEQAFRGCTDLTSVTLHENVTSIGEYAFYDCSSLTDVYCYAENVPSTSKYAFDDSSISSATLHVPAGFVESYRATIPWKYFKSIVAIE